MKKHITQHVSNFIQSHFLSLAMALLVAIALLHFTLAKIPSQTQVNFLDIGQGDAILVVTPSLHAILIDGGPGETVLEEIGAVLPFFMRDIDLMVMTHPHRDHMEGLIEVLKRYDTHHVLIPGDAYGSGLYREFLRIASEATGSAPALHFAQSKTDIKVPIGSIDSDHLILDILHPIQNIAGQEYENTNNASIVMKMSSMEPPSISDSSTDLKSKNGLFEPKNRVKSVRAHTSPGKTFLFTGDCEEECEHEILEYYLGLRAEEHQKWKDPAKARVWDQRIQGQTDEMSKKLHADVLKVGHHGSRTSTSQKFLQAIAPKIAVIQSGVDNQFEHPHPETLQKLQEAGIEIRRNDLEGRVTISTNFDQ